jgi:hypothetical protein
VLFPAPDGPSIGITKGSCAARRRGGWDELGPALFARDCDARRLRGKNRPATSVGRQGHLGAHAPKEIDKTGE